MAYTVKQYINAFAILETPYSFGYFQLDGMGSTTMDYQIAQAAAQAAKTVILSAMDALDTDVQTELKDALDRYETLKFSRVSIEGGQVSDVGNVTYSDVETIKSIKAYVQTILPFFRQHEVMAKRNGNTIMGSLLH